MRQSTFRISAVLGMLLLVFSLLGLGFFLMMDVSVPVGLTGDRVANLERMHNRQIGIIVSGALCVLGGWMAFRKP